MQPQTKRNYLIGVLTALIVLRFILVPILDWQQEQIDQISAKSERVAKVTNVIERLPKITEELEKLQQERDKQLSRYYQEPSLNIFKLQLQQQIESLFAKHNVKVKNFTWAAEIIADVTQERASITYEGQTIDFIKLQLAIARSPKLMNIAQWSLNIKKMTNESLGNATGSLVIITYNVTSAPGSKNDKG